MSRLYGSEGNADGGGLVVTERDGIECINVAFLVCVQCQWQQLYWWKGRL